MPAKATYRREDGIVVQNFRRCIGCKYCIVACPYGVRNFNYKEPEEKEYHRPDLPPNRTERGVWPFPQRVHGVVEKCTFCFHRIDQAITDGKKIGSEVVPACAEACGNAA
jgi:molybdopterin-containing oxidoreductase family iron-sulfur binding subunit